MERAELLRKTWGIDIQYSNAESTYPMDILERGQQIGRIICSYGCKFLVIELSGIGKLNRDKELPGRDALEVWDFQNPPLRPNRTRRRHTDRGAHLSVCFAMGRTARAKTLTY